MKTLFLLVTMLFASSVLASNLSIFPVGATNAIIVHYPAEQISLQIDMDKVSTSIEERNMKHILKEIPYTLVKIEVPALLNVLNEHNGRTVFEKSMTVNLVKYGAFPTDRLADLGGVDTWEKRLKGLLLSELEKFNSAPDGIGVTLKIYPTNFSVRVSSVERAGAAIKNSVSSQMDLVSSFWVGARNDSRTFVSDQCQAAQDGFGKCLMTVGQKLKGNEE